MIQEAYVSYGIAQLLKKKGFNWECRTCYEHGELKTEVCRQYADWNSRHEVWELMSAPTHQMAMTWLREVHKLHIAILWDCGACIEKNSFCYHIYRIDNYEDRGYNKIGFDSNEEAVEAALKYVLENLFIMTKEEQIETNHWHDAQGNDLPEIDREVIVLRNNGQISFGHRPNPDGEVWKHPNGTLEHVYFKTYDKGGWNIPNVKWWCDINLPKEGGEE